MGAKLREIYDYIQATSLDVVLGSGLFTLSIARYYKVDLPLSVVGSLMIAVWLIYTYDHLSDAKKINKTAASFRHRFHQQNFWNLNRLMYLALMAGAAVVCFLPAKIVKNGVICAAIVIFYFMLLRLRGFWLKEALIALCYTVGVFLGPLSLVQESLNFFQLILIPQVFLLALSNLIIFSWFDYENDQADAQYSIAIHFGSHLSRLIAFGLLCTGLLLCIIMVFTAQQLITIEVQLIVFSMNFLLLMILLKEKRFRKNDRFRAVGDGIFLLPSLILIYAA